MNITHMKRCTKRMRKMYPNIVGMIYNPVFYERWTGYVNSWRHFHILIETPRHKFECEICHEPIHKRKARKYMVCEKCLRKYVTEVRLGKRTPRLYVVKVAA
jgi:ribosomal protein L37AE/L43A